MTVTRRQGKAQSSSAAAAASGDSNVMQEQSTSTMEENETKPIKLQPAEDELDAHVSMELDHPSGVGQHLEEVDEEQACCGMRKTTFIFLAFRLL